MKNKIASVVSASTAVAVAVAIVVALLLLLMFLLRERVQQIECHIISTRLCNVVYLYYNAERTVASSIELDDRLVYVALT